MGDAHGFAFWRGRGRVHNLLPVQKRGQGADAGITDGRTISPSPRAQTGCGRSNGHELPAINRGTH